MGIVAAVGLTACSSEDNFDNNQQPAQSEVHTYSVCIPATFGDAQTRAVVTGTDPISGKPNLVGQFKTTEKIMVYNVELHDYAKSMSAWTYLSPDADNATTANLVGTLAFENAIAEGQTLRLIYNHTNTTAQKLQYYVWASEPAEIQYQPGTLAGLSNYDFAIADVTISAGGISGTGPYTLTTSAANFENMQSMFKFTFTGLPTGVGVQKLVVSSANKRIVTQYDPISGTEYTTVPAVEILLDDAARTANSPGVVYAAIRFLSGADDITFTVTGTDGNDYIATKSTTGFSNGKYYTATLAMAGPFKKAAAATDSDKGKLICTAGHIHAYDADAVCTAARVAKIIYVGNDNCEAEPYNHGLALAMSDANSGSTCIWETSDTDAGHTTQGSPFTIESGLQYNATHNTDDYPAFKYAIANNGTAAPVGCSAWFLASGYQWGKMLTAAGSYTALRDGFYGVGGTNMQSNNYWSSSECDASQAWAYVFEYGNAGVGFKSKNYYVRSALAF